MICATWHAKCKCKGHIEKGFYTASFDLERTYWQSACHVLKLCAKFERNRPVRARSYSDLKIENLRAVRHLGFPGTWVSTTAGPAGTSLYSEPTLHYRADCFALHGAHYLKGCLYYDTCATPYMYDVHMR